MYKRVNKTCCVCRMVAYGSQNFCTIACGCWLYDFLLLLELLYSCMREIIYKRVKRTCWIVE
jgi:hypothetical protein